MNIFKGNTNLFDSLYLIILLLFIVEYFLFLFYIKYSSVLSVVKVRLFGAGGADDAWLLFIIGTFENPLFLFTFVLIHCK